MSNIQPIAPGFTSREFKPEQPGDDTPQPKNDDYFAWANQYALIAVTDQIYHKPTGTRLTLSGWRNHNAHLHSTSDDGSKVPWTSRFKRDANVTRCMGFCMKPGQGKYIGGDLNFWDAPRAFNLEKTGDPNSKVAQDFRRLVLHLAGEREDIATQLLNWTATGLFKPEQRPLWAPILVSQSKGMGKGIFTHTLAKLYGDSMTSELASLKQVTGQFSGAYCGKMFVSVAETVDTGHGVSRFSAVESLKALITEPRLSLELKGKDPVSVDNHARFIFSSNHLDGLKIDNDERRFMVVDMGDTAPLSNDFYKRLAISLKTERGLADVAAMLRSYVIDDLQVRAPRADMSALQAAFIPEWAKDLTAQFKDEPTALKSKDVQRKASEWAGRTLSGKATTRAMKEAGWTDQNLTRLGGRVLVNVPDSKQIRDVTLLAYD